MKTALSRWRWLVFAALLVGLGYVLHGWFGPVERWSLELDENESTYSFSADGAYLISNGGPSGEDHEWAGPFRKRDASTGELLAEMSRRGIVYEDHSQNSEWSRRYEVPTRKRYWAALPALDRGTLHLFDLESGVERHLPIEPYPDWRWLMLSPREDMVAVSHELKSAPEDEMERTHDIVLYAIPSGERLTVLKKAGSTWAEFAPDGSYFVYYTMKNGRLSLNAWDTNKRQDACVLPGAAWNCEVSANSRYLMYEEPDGVGIWDMSDLAEPAHRGVIPTQLIFCRFLPDSRTILEEFSHQERDTFVFWDAVNGKERGRLVDPKFIDGGHSIYYQSISPDSASWAMVFGTKGNWFLAVVNLSTRTVAWKMPISLFGEMQVPQNVVFAGGPKTIVLAQDSQVELRQAQTGALLASYPMPYSRISGPTLSANGRYVHFFGEGENAAGKNARSWLWEHMPDWLQARLKWQFNLLRVIEIENQREVFHLADTNVRESQLSPEGRTLLTTHVTVWNGEFSGSTLRCWDVPARKPWTWIIGVPGGIGVSVLAWKWLRRKRKAAA